MRTGLSIALVALFFSTIIISQGIAQQCSGGNCKDSVKAPFDGLYLYGGARFIDYDGLDASLNALGYKPTENAVIQGGITVERTRRYADSELPTSTRLSLYYFALPEEFDLKQGTTGEIHAWGLSVTGVLPFVYTNSARFALTLGIGWEWSTLTIRKEITFEDFVENATANSAEAARHSAILQPGLRFDYRFTLFGDPLILGLEAGYAWDYTFDNTWGEKIVGIGDDSNSGFFAMFNIGFPFGH